MKRVIPTFLFLLFFCVIASGQNSPDSNLPEPLGGAAQLAAVFDRMQLSEAEVRSSRHLPMILIFAVSASGEASLIDMSRVEFASLRDSIFSRKDSLPRFRPKMSEGQPEPSLFGLRYSYRKDYEMLPEEDVWFYMRRGKPRNTDVSSYEIGSRDLWIRFEAGPNIFYNGAAEYLHPGVGIGAEVGLPRQKVDHAWVIGFDSFFNRRSAEIPLETERAQRNTVHTVVYHLGYAMASGRNRWTPSVNYMSSSLVRRGQGERSIDDDRWGFGVTYTRLFPFRKESFKFSEGVSMNRYYFTMSFRPSYYFSGSTAFDSGFMFNLYFGIAMQSFNVSKHNLKESYYEGL